MIWFGWVLWHINHCRLCNAKFSLYIYIKYTWFGLVGFYGISITVGYLMANPLYTYILNIYDLVWFGLVLWHINQCRLFNVKFSLYILNIWFVNTFCRLDFWISLRSFTLLSVKYFKHFYQTGIILFTINHLFELI